MNSLTQLLSKEVAEAFVAAGKSDQLPGLAEDFVRALGRRIHPDRTLDLPESVQSLFSNLFINSQMALEDIKDEDGLAEAIDELETPEYRRRSADRKDQYREVETLQQTVGALFGLTRAIDQFQVMDVSQPTSVLLEPGGARAVLEVMSHSKTRLLVSTSDDDVLPEQPEQATFVEGSWTESYLDPNNSARQRRYVHRLEALGVVTVIGFVAADAVQRYYNSASLPSDALSMLGEGQSPLRFAPNWSFPKEAWFGRFLTHQRQLGSEVVVANNQGLVATVGSIVAQASK